MSAMPRPRSGVDRALPRRLPTLDAPADAGEFFGLVPAGPLRRKDLSDRAKVAMAGLCVVARGSRTWVQASVADVMAATGHSERKTRQGLRELTSAGVIEWDTIGEKFRVLFRLRGPGESGPSAPAPRIAPDPDPNGSQTGAETDPKRAPKRSESPAPHTPLVLEREMGEATGEGEPAGPVEPSDPIPDDVAELVRRAAAVFGVVSPADVRAHAARFGADAVGAAISHCRGRGARDFGAYTLPILEEWEREGAVISAREPAPMQNYNPGPKYKPIPAEERAGLRDWRKLVPRDDPGPAQETPAAGPLGKDPPPPVRELSDVPAATVSYRETVFTTRVRGDRLPIAHPSPRDSDPVPPPTGGDSSIDRTQAAGPRGGGRVAAGARGAAASEARSPAPRGGAQPGPARGARAAGSPGPGLPRPSDPESDGAGPGRQRLSGPRPAFHPRE